MANRRTIFLERHLLQEGMNQADPPIVGQTQFAIRAGLSERIISDAMNGRAVTTRSAVSIAMALFGSRDFLALTRQDKKSYELPSNQTDVAQTSRVENFATFQLICRTTVKAFVDLVRLNFVFVAPEARDAVRADEFREISQMSQTDLRHQIASFSAEFHSENKLLLTEILRLMSFVSINFSSIAKVKSRRRDENIYYEEFFFIRRNENWKSLVNIAKQIEHLLNRNHHLVSKEFSDDLQRTLEDIECAFLPERIEPENFYPIRWRAQDMIQDRLKLSYILLDTSERTNLAYCALDLLLFKKLNVQ